MEKTIREFFRFVARERDPIYIEVTWEGHHKTVWNGNIYDIDNQGVTVKEKDGSTEWISYEDLEDWKQRDMLFISVSQ